MPQIQGRIAFLSFLGFFLGATGAAGSAECDNWQTRNPAWIFCDDFEKDAPMVGTGRYFEYDDNQGDFAVTQGAGVGGSKGMRVRWQTGEVEAGNLKIGFGRVPGAYFAKGIRPDTDFREIYYRLFVRLQAGWKGNPYKLSRATVLAKADWSQAMIAHLWGDPTNKLQLDPVRCTDGSSLVKCAGYNDFTDMEWIGAEAGSTPIFSGAFDNKWLCVEAHVRLNDAGKANGVHEYWINDTLEARREGLDFLGSYSAYGLNAVFLENHWNSGSPQLQERYFDNVVVSTAKIGCAESQGAPALLNHAPDHAPLMLNGVLKMRGATLGESGLEGSAPDISGPGGMLRSITGRRIPRAVTGLEIGVETAD